MNTALRIALVTLASALGLAGASAQTFNWGNTINFEGSAGFQEMSFDSNGVAIDQTGTTFTFEVGTFSSGFTPDVSNVDFWGTNWSPMQNTSYSMALNYFTGSYSMTAADAVRQGERAYIWVYDTDIASSTAEWFLVTGDTEGGGAAGATSDENWRVPTLGGAGGTFDWRLSTANTAVWGGLNNDGDPGFNGPNEDIGAGEQNVDPGVFELQTFAVPEPSSAVFGLFGLALALRRRR